jgi:hypothetical protein
MDSGFTSASPSPGLRGVLGDDGGGDHTYRLDFAGGVRSLGASAVEPHAAQGLGLWAAVESIMNF